MLRFVLWLLAAVIAFGGANSAFGPSREVSAAFDRYKRALVTGDRPSEAKLVAPNVIEHFARVRELALRADRATVSALPFIDRIDLFSYRHAVHSGSMDVAVLQITDPHEFYAVIRGALPSYNASFENWRLLLVVPSAPGEAWGVVDPLGLPESTLMALFGPFRFRFLHKDGQWLVDTMPLLRSSAGENEYYARMMEPTGNTFIFHFLGVSDSTAIEQLWQPLQ